MQCAPLCTLRYTHLAHELRHCPADAVGAVLLEEVQTLDGDLGLVGPGATHLALAPELPDQRIPAAGEIRLKHLLELYGSVDVWGYGNNRCLTC